MQRDGLFPVAVQATKGKGKAEKAARADKAAVPKPLKEGERKASFFRRKNRKPKLQDSATWMLQLANLLRSGMPLTMALNSMVSISGKGISEEVAVGLKQDVNEGKTLSEAMAKNPVIFNEMSINMVRAGEELSLIHI